jgi:hypothetical protein
MLRFETCKAVGDMCAEYFLSAVSIPLQDIGEAQRIICDEV